MSPDLTHKANNWKPTEYPALKSDSKGSWPSELGVRRFFSKTAPVRPDNGNYQNQYNCSEWSNLRQQHTICIESISNFCRQSCRVSWAKLDLLSQAWWSWLLTSLVRSVSQILEDHTQICQLEKTTPILTGPPYSSLYDSVCLHLTQRGNIR